MKLVVAAGKARRRIPERFMAAADFGDQQRQVRFHRHLRTGNGSGELGVEAVEEGADPFARRRGERQFIEQAPPRRFEQRPESGVLPEELQFPPREERRLEHQVVEDQFGVRIERVGRSPGDHVEVAGDGGEGHVVDEIHSVPREYVDHLDAVVEMFVGDVVFFPSLDVQCDRQFAGFEILEMKCFHDSARIFLRGYSIAHDRRKSNRVRRKTSASSRSRRIEKCATP